MREAQIRARLVELRSVHPELDRPLTWTTLRQLLARDESIVVTTHRIGPKARIRAMGGVAVISFRVKLPPREWLFAGAHEWAHWLLHGDHEAPTRGYVTRRHRADDPREIEADFLARCLIAGPDVHVPWPTPEPRPTPRAKPTPAWDPYSAPPVIAQIRREPAYGGRFAETPLRRALRRALRHAAPKPYREGPVHDHGIIHYERGGVVRFEDADGIRWRVHDVAYFDVAGVRTRRVIPPGSETAKYRYFVNANGGQRFYRFSKWERRDVAPAHLERQLREATQVPARRRQLRQAGGKGA
jgi:hypothetical protein